MWKYDQVNFSLLYDYSTVSVFLYYITVVFLSIGMIFILSSSQDRRTVIFICEHEE